MIAFKLTKPEMQSCGFCCPNNPAITKYVLGKWVKPHKHCGPLAVFENYTDLINFKLEYQFDMGATRIFVCEIKKSKSKKMWYTNSGGLNEIHNFMFPNGTILAGSVKLIKEVK